MEGGSKEQNLSDEKLKKNYKEEGVYLSLQSCPNLQVHLRFEISNEFTCVLIIIVGKKMSTDSSESIQSHKHTQALILVPYLFQCLFPVPHISSIKQYTFTMCNVHACEVWITYCCRPIISEAPVMACGKGSPPSYDPFRNCQTRVDNESATQCNSRNATHRYSRNACIKLMQQ